MSRFSDEWAIALKEQFTHFGRAATHRDKDLSKSPCVVIVNAADQVESIGGVSIVAGQFVLKVRACEIPKLKKGDVFEVSGQELAIVAAPRFDDPHRLVWTCLCDLQPAL